MYKVFFDNKKIWVTNNLRKARKKKGKLFSLTTLSVKDFLKKVEKAKSGKFVFYIDKGEDFFSYFTSALICIEAGGGVVRNPKGRILFIKRKGKWDLPKGKLEKGENISECALREVEEETGISQLSLKGFRSITYHIFSRDNKFFLKETHWFDMFSTFEDNFVPQKEEDIEKVTWKSDKKLRKTLKKSFLNIKELFLSEKM